MMLLSIRLQDQRVVVCCVQSQWLMVLFVVDDSHGEVMTQRSMERKKEDERSKTKDLFLEERSIVLQLPRMQTSQMALSLIMEAAASIPYL